MTLINMALVALQPLSAGLFMSGYRRFVVVHATVGMALQVGAIVQSIAAIVLWRKRRVPGWVAAFSVGLFAIAFLQVGFGYSNRHWLHVPIGVGMLGWLKTQRDRLTS